MYVNTHNTRGIIVTVLILVGIGTFMVYSSTAFMSMREYGNGFHYLLKHLFTVAVGTVVLLSLAKLDYRRLRPWVYVLLAAGFVMLLLVFVPGIGLSANGASRWLRLWPTTFQPSEFVKVVMVIFLAHHMDRNREKMKTFKYGILIPVGVMVGFQMIIIMQPDFGSVMSLAILTVCLLILGGARLKYIGMLLLVCLPAVYMLITGSGYRMKRIMCFTDPWKDAFGCGFQLVQSFIAFGNGSLFGVGLGGSKQKLYFLPEGHTDFIFSLIGEEMGFVGVLAVIGVFVWFFRKGMHVSDSTNDPFSYYLTLGLTMMIGVQALINFAVSTGLMPTKGLPLPFISYGGSALLMNMAAAGILISIASRNERCTEAGTSYVDVLSSRGTYARRIR